MANPHFASPFNFEKRCQCEGQEIVAKGEKGQYPLEYSRMATQIDQFFRLFSVFTYHDYVRQFVQFLYAHSDLKLLPEGTVKTICGEPISHNHLAGKSVALYFADGEDSKCTSFLPILIQFYKTINEGGQCQKIEVIFVSLDKNEDSYNHHRALMPWLSIDFNHPIAQVLKKHYRVMKPREVFIHGVGPRSPPPALVIIGSEGEEKQFLPITSGREEGVRGLLRWDWRNSIFNPFAAS
ncbi:PDI family protein [Cardiosporidium cionae]|uniref:protein-disulfide reductase n=1 Tax=Cardiosporidium cionae TaxID=476202 RepID=A0ABQ7J641_9APIC|nr:PDI family protein [Cardiosporidium cionae]|eukprot:KAF8819448.1 PDI family protein [Cardiosporidium cionae]